MKNIKTVISLVGLISYVVLTANSGYADLTVANLANKPNLNVCLKYITQSEKSGFGIDYKLSGQKTVEGTNGSLSLNLKSDGFISFNSNVNNQNSVVTEVNLESFIYRIPGASTANGPSPIIIDTQEAMQTHASPSPLSLYWDLHLKHETTPDFKYYDLAAGTAARITTSYLNKIFDLLPSDKNNGTRQLEVILGYDNITNLDQTLNKEVIGSETSANRFSVKAEWETGIFEADRIIFGYNLNNLWDPANKLMAANKNNYSFFMAKYEHLLNQVVNTQTAFALIYTSGALPPNYETGYSLGGGLSILF